MLARRALEQRADAVDVALDDVPPEPGARGDGTLQVHRRPDAEVAQRGTSQRLRHDVGRERVAVEVGDGQAAAVHRDGVAVGCIGRDQRAAQRQPNRIAERLDADDAPLLLNQAGEHQLTPSPARCS